MHFFLSPKFLLICCCFLLGACGRQPTGPYAKWLSNHEEVLSVKNAGPFTILHVERRSVGWGSFHGTGDNFDRILYRGKVVVKEAHATEAWEGLEKPAIFAEIYSDSKSRLNLVYERDGRSIVKRIDAGADGWTQYNFGEPIGPGLRYFPNLSGRTQGFLVRAFPLEVKVLPLGPSNPTIWQLASLAPDSKAFAYADELESPSVVVVVDEKGQIGEPIPIPVKTGQARTWFDAYFNWQKNAAGRWDIAKRAPGPATQATGSALEELFLDADAGYRDCFANSIACRGGWRREQVKDPEAYDCRCDFPFQYMPLKAVQAFGANVREMWYSRIANGSAYELVLDASPDKVGSQLRKRLDERNINYLAPEEISRERVEAFLEKDMLRDDWIYAFSDQSKSLQFVMPTVAVKVEAFEQGTLIRAVARYPAKH